MLCLRALALLSVGLAFRAPPVSRAVPPPRSRVVTSGLFDAFAKAFQNEDYSALDMRVRASHILIKGADARAKVAALRAELADAGDAPAEFARVARRESMCASAANGGDLKEFGPGKMVAEFDEVLFCEPPPPVGAIIGPVDTQFGSHLILVAERGRNNDQVTELLARND